ncbi:Oidioi.mRNA.OKI2018_I69.XSR.g15561.t1.cds [Oikopleura dioica]|uniref:Signal recognition particle 14 kDa protein n=1 Tax=Oikopleura dioica TaxID=34765 RepID=A0ABN7SID7_OIKDI|nr:Oidioi.mRNA.OKI2018_I69.XSR.g15561.t1.cds [Oikopleura dioica]
MVFVEREKFLHSMNRMFQNNREGTVRMSVKPYDGQDRPMPKDGSKKKWTSEKLVLIRLTSEKEKISTVIEHELPPQKTDSEKEEEDDRQLESSSDSSCDYPLFSFVF